MYTTIRNNRHRKVIELPHEVLRHGVLPYSEASEGVADTTNRVFLPNVFSSFDNSKYISM